MSDVPNSAQTWITAQQTPVEDLSGKEENVNWQNPQGAFKKTKEEIGFINGNPGISWALASSSLLSACANFLVWGFLALNLILSKLALAILCMFLSLAFLLAAIPVGDMPRRILKRWASACLPAAVTGILASLFGSICVFITQAVMNQSSSAPSLVVGASPLLALWAVNLFCQKVLRIGKPLSIKNTIDSVRSESAAGDLQRAVQRGIRMASHPIENAKAAFRAPFRPLGEIHRRQESSIPKDLWRKEKEAISSKPPANGNTCETKQENAKEGAASPPPPSADPETHGFKKTSGDTGAPLKEERREETKSEKPQKGEKEAPEKERKEEKGSLKEQEGAAAGKEEEGGKKKGKANQQREVSKEEERGRKEAEQDIKQSKNMPLDYQGKIL